MNLRKNKKIIQLALMLIILIIIFILIKLLVENKQKTLNNNDVSISSKEEEEKEELMDELRDVSESERIKIYLSTYFKYIENKDYNSAYELLYPEFKENYFPTVEDYSKYLEESYYPEMIALDFYNIYMQGKYYVVEINVKDFLDTGRAPREELFIVMENGYNDFYISFKK